MQGKYSQWVAPHYKRESQPQRQKPNVLLSLWQSPPQQKIILLSPCAVTQNLVRLNIISDLLALAPPRSFTLRTTTFFRNFISYLRLTFAQSFHATIGASITSFQPSPLPSLQQCFSFSLLSSKSLSLSQNDYSNYTHSRSFDHLIVRSSARPHERPSARAHERLLSYSRALAIPSLTDTPSYLLILDATHGHRSNDTFVLLNLCSTDLHLSNAENSLSPMFSFRQSRLSPSTHPQQTILLLLLFLSAPHEI